MKKKKINNDECFVETKKQQQKIFYLIGYFQISSTENNVRFGIWNLVFSKNKENKFLKWVKKNVSNVNLMTAKYIIAKVN